MNDKNKTVSADFDESLSAELFSVFKIDSDAADELEAAGVDNVTPTVTLTATVTGWVEC